ncbi:MAG: ribosomal protein S18-alanine N-acetyltransferase [Candidatus Accumulibacter sp.]|jgi:ribosomal-protein-alanine N-acetyltransferase|nr:ribosomal protein S18-alanine N-acetyltransferase [Accumulibacter sp.]
MEPSLTKPFPESEVVFLPMTEDDLDEVLSIEIRVNASPWGHGHFMDSISNAHLAQVCRAGGLLVGFFVVMVAVDEAHLLTLGVAEKFQGVGFGARLLHHAMDLAHRSGMNYFLLEVRPSNTRALALYTQYGFQQIGLRRAYYPPEGGVREDALVMRRPLGEIVA